ncbi:MAG: pentapeptide repeat-containing protein [Acidimicrobiales bacterium]
MAGKGAVADDLRCVPVLRPARTSLHDASLHDASLHDASLHDASLHDASLHDAVSSAPRGQR